MWPKRRQWHWRRRRPQWDSRACWHRAMPMTMPMTRRRATMAVAAAVAVAWRQWQPMAERSRPCQARSACQRGRLSSRRQREVQLCREISCRGNAHRARGTPAVTDSMHACAFDLDRPGLVSVTGKKSAQMHKVRAESCRATPSTHFLSVSRVQPRKMTTTPLSF